MYYTQILLNLGQALKEAREDQGLTLEQVSEKTKISVYTLQAIEEAKAEELPVYTYLRGFILSYAQVLDMDLKEIEKSFSSLLNKGEETYKSNVVASSSEVENFIEKDLRLTPIVLAVSILFVVACIIIFLDIVQSYKKESVNSLVPPTQVEEVETVFEEKDIKPQEEKMEEEVVKPPAAEDQILKKPAPKEKEETEKIVEEKAQLFPKVSSLEIIIKAQEAAQISYKVDKNKKTELVLEKDQFKVIKALESILIEAEDASLIKIFKNGKNLGVFGSKGKKKKLFSSKING